jgi:hypothetical protein
VCGGGDMGFWASDIYCKYLPQRPFTGKLF